MINDKAILVGVDACQLQGNMVGRELCKARGADAADCLRIFPAELCRRFVRCHLHGDGGR